MTPSEIAQIITDTNRRSTVVRFALSLLQINQVRGYCGRTDPAYEGEEVSDFYDGLEFVSKIDSDIRLCIDAYVKRGLAQEYHRRPGISNYQEPAESDKYSVSPEIRKSLFRVLFGTHPHVSYC
jgi:hypothetical protein